MAKTAQVSREARIKLHHASLGLFAQYPNRLVSNGSAASPIPAGGRELRALVLSRPVSRWELQFWTGRGATLILFLKGDGKQLKVSRTLIVLVVVVIVGVVGLFAYSYLQSPASACSSTWKCAASYPIQVGGTFGVAGEQCATNSTYVYCVGGVDANGGPRNEVYTGTISNSGNITGWNLDPNGYPQDVSGQSCVVSSSYMYCVGGIHDDAGDDVASSYYANLENNGSVGPWQSTTPYPIPIDSESCVTSSSYIYCIGGNNETSGSYSNIAPSDSVWYAQISSAGIGTWVRTTPYSSSVYVPTCFAANGYAYCVGGVDPSGSPVGTAYYAPLTSSGVGEWIQTSAYPVQATGQACATADGYVYCVGGETSGGQSPAFTSAVYFAQVANGGLGAWKAGPDFPNTVGTSCAATSSNMYCMGGFDQSSAGLNPVVNFALLSSFA
jgi:hypothetical protein